MSDTDNLINRIDSLEISLKEMQKVLNELTGAGMKKKSATVTGTSKPMAAEDLNNATTDKSKKTKTTKSESTTDSTAPKPHLEFAKLWKEKDGAFRSNLLSAFPNLQKAIESDEKVKAELKPAGRLNKEQLLAWKLCKPDKKNDEKLVKYVADLMKKSSEVCEVEQLKKED